MNPPSEHHKMNYNLPVQLNPLLDKDKKTYFVGHIAFPGLLNLNLGIAFLAFVAEKEVEELQIALVDSDTNNFSNYQRRHDRIVLEMHPSLDRNEKTFYVGKLRMPGYIDCQYGVDFVFYNSRPGYEQVQIVAPVIENPFQPARRAGRRELAINPEIIRVPANSSSY